MAAKKQKIIRKWNNTYFVQIYIRKLHSLFVNLKKDESNLESQVEISEIEETQHIDRTKRKSWKKPG